MLTAVEIDRLRHRYHNCPLEAARTLLVAIDTITEKDHQIMALRDRILDLTACIRRLELDKIIMEERLSWPSADEPTQAHG